MRKRLAAGFLALLLGVSFSLNVFAAAPTVRDVEKYIDQIGTVTRDNRQAVEKAVDAYYQLENDEKSQVTNYAVLAEAQQILGIQDAVANLQLGYDKENDAVILMSPYTEKNEKAGSCTVAPVIYASDKYGSPIMFLFFEFLGGEYLQTNTVQVKVGGQTYQYHSKDFVKTTYGTIKQGNKTYHIERGIRVANQTDLKMLSAMLREKTVTVHFVGGADGEVKTMDYTLSKYDRQAINDVLYAYELMDQASSEVLHKVLV